MRPGLVSVMMPAYNAEQYINQAIQSVIDQTYPDWELIIVNDGSSDGTANVISRFSDPRIHLIQQANCGEAAARNAALQSMQGEFVAFLDADDIYLPDHLDVTVNYLLTHPSRGGVYTDGYHCDGNGTRLQSLSSRRRGPFEGRIFEEVVYGSDVFGPPVCVVLRRSLIVQNGLEFDRDITIGPDWLFFMAYSDLAEFGYLDLHTCMYRIHQKNITSTTSLDKRALELAKCRERSLRLENFNSCSLETRWNVFYDLLVNLLSEFPERQMEIVTMAEFGKLPCQLQAKLYRLMASKAIVGDYRASHIKEYLQHSIELWHRDWRGWVLLAIYIVNPSICQRMLSQKYGYSAEAKDDDPFADLRPASLTK